MSPSVTGSRERCPLAPRRTPSRGAVRRSSAVDACRPRTSQTARRVRGHVGLVGDRDHDLTPARREPRADAVATARVERAERVVDQQQRRLADLGRHRGGEPEAEAERRRPRLAVGGERARAEVAHRQRRGRRGAGRRARSGAGARRRAVPRSAPGRHPRDRRRPTRWARSARRARTPAIARELLVGEGGEPLDGVGARPDHGAARLDQLLVPGLDARAARPGRSHSFSRRFR